jgi:hypothetical protein
MSFLNVLQQISIAFFAFFAFLRPAILVSLSLQPMLFGFTGVTGGESSESEISAALDSSSLSSSRKDRSYAFVIDELAFLFADLPSPAKSWARPASSR